MEELHSEEVQEILSTPPSWMVQWGTALVFIILAALVALGYWFKYPESVVAPLTITTLQPPIPVYSPRGGYIDRLVVADGDSVAENAILAVMSNTANLEDVIRLEEALQKLQGFDEEALVAFKPDPNLRLGELQDDYKAFVQFYQEFSFKQSSTFDQRAIRRYRDQIVELDKAITALNSELRNAIQARDLAQTQFKALHYAYSGKTPQELKELQEANSLLLEKDSDINRLKADIANKKKEKAAINLQKLAIQEGSSSSSGTSRYQILLQTLNSLQTKVDQWKQHNLLLAPASGIVTYYQVLLSERAPVKEGSSVMAILPVQIGDMELIGLMQLPVAQSGKVQPGQRVLIKLDGFPFQEFGIVDGRVEDKALLPENGAYSVRVVLPNGLHTSFDSELPFRQQMLAKGEIIIQDKRLLQRLLEKAWEVVY
ncbi:MAG: HlyD family efflux transporter periplasmic adaptor subunit [Saprospirales bacterium]|nr:HlyD family efflux transporter periplasmic adaptor subunit [Saprospirales bacterium]MBK8492119.1 HlyD family efflux transporter periplasmic adaptor subunit [Saprospirales bacterium]